MDARSKITHPPQFSASWLCLGLAQIQIVGSCQVVGARAPRITVQHTPELYPERNLLDGKLFESLLLLLIPYVTDSSVSAHPDFRVHTDSSCP